MEQIRALIADIVKNLYDVDAPVVLTRPDEQFGDYATNIALQISKQLGKNPREIAEAIVAELQDESIAQTDVAGPGFINMTLHDSTLIDLTKAEPPRSLAGLKYVVEYSCPNYFKELHAGHLYQTLVGDVIARLIERAGAEVHRTNFGGDVGQHVARAMWGMLRALGGENAAALGEIDNSVMGRAAFISDCYVKGSKAYAEDESAKAEIESLNKRIYGLYRGEDDGSDFATIYYSAREWSKAYFVELYKQLDVTEFDKYYPESSTEGRGVAEVTKHTGTIFSESDGAIVFNGEEYGLHTRVFITSQGLPTYEAKDLGLIFMELEEFASDKRILITGNDQSEYMKVVWKAADLIRPGLADTMSHLTNGTIRFGDGKKMSSRMGNVTKAVAVLQKVRELMSAETNQADEQIVLGAVKYEFLKYRLGGDIAFDPQESVALEGNSGPYLQYAHARARSILRKANTSAPLGGELPPDERSLVRKIGQYAETVTQATEELMPHHICTYLYELAQSFNRFYEYNRVIGDERQDVRLALVQAYADTLKDGLKLLGIHAPDQM